MKVKEVYMKGEGVNKWENGSANKIGKEQLQSIGLWSHKRI